MINNQYTGYQQFIHNFLEKFHFLLYLHLDKGYVLGIFVM